MAGTYVGLDGVRALAPVLAETRLVHLSLGGTHRIIICWFRANKGLNNACFLAAVTL